MLFYYIVLTFIHFYGNIDLENLKGALIMTPAKQIPNRFPTTGAFYFPNDLIDDKELSPACLRIYAALTYYIVNGKNNPSFKDLQEITYNKAYRTVKQAVDELEMAGWIKVYDNGKGFAPTYEVFTKKQLPEAECVNKSDIGFGHTENEKENIKQINRLTAKRRNNET